MKPTEWIKPEGARGAAAWPPEVRARNCRLGGLSTSKDRGHMATIGREGGKKVSRDRAYMAKIGRKGGSASRKSAQP